MENNESVIHKYSTMYIYKNIKTFEAFNDKIVI